MKNKGGRNMKPTKIKRICDFVGQAGHEVIRHEETGHPYCPQCEDDRDDMSPSKAGIISVEAMTPKPTKTRLQKNQEMREYNQKRMALIAAGPALLEAAKKAQKLIGHLRMGEDLPTQETWDALCAAIAQAEGE
jgi:hypothetical protein